MKLPVPMPVLTGRLHFGQRVTALVKVRERAIYSALKSVILSTVVRLEWRRWMIEREMMEMMVVGKVVKFTVVKFGSH